MMNAVGASSTRCKGNSRHSHWPRRTRGEEPSVTPPSVAPAYSSRASHITTTTSSLTELPSQCLLGVQLRSHVLIPPLNSPYSTYPGIASSINEIFAGCTHRARGDGTCSNWIRLTGVAAWQLHDTTRPALPNFLSLSHRCSSVCLL